MHNNVVFPSHASSRCGVLCPWTNSEEWEAVYSWMFNKDLALVHKAIDRVAAWKARASVPIAVELTADLAECQLWDWEHGDSTEQALSLMYSMAITRFINGIKDVSLVTHKLGACDILTAVSEYNIPGWVVTLRHEATHRRLPPLSPLRIAADFALGWLRDHYWRPERELMGERSCPEEGGGEKSSLPSTTTLFHPPNPRWKVMESGEKPPLVYRLTRGLFDRKTSLIDFLGEGRHSELVQQLKKGHLLQMPASSKHTCTVAAPVVTDLASFPTLETSSGGHNLGGWRALLLKASEKNGLTRYNLLTALIVAVHDQECSSVEMRDYLAAWLGILLKESYIVRVEEMKGVEIVHIVDDEEQFIPGVLDWKMLLKVAKAHPGYYSYATVSCILPHVELSKAQQEKLLCLLTLVTLSDRIGHSIPFLGEGKGKYTQELEEMKMAVQREERRRRKRKGREEEGQTADQAIVINSDDSETEPSPKRAKAETSSGRQQVGGDGRQQTGGRGRQGEEEMDASIAAPRWKPVPSSEVSSWACCPLGLCPGQQVTPTFLDLPVSRDHYPARRGSLRPNDVHRPSPPTQAVTTAEAPQSLQRHVFTRAQVENMQQRISCLLYPFSQQLPHRAG